MEVSLASDLKHESERHVPQEVYRKLMLRGCGICLGVVYIRLFDNDSVVKRVLNREVMMIGVVLMSSDDMIHPGRLVTPFSDPGPIFIVECILFI